MRAREGTADAPTRAGAGAGRRRRLRADGRPVPDRRDRPADVRPAGRPGHDPGRRSASAWPRVDPDAPHPLNLFRVHWYNGPDRRRRIAVPDHVVLPPSLTGRRRPDRRRPRRSLPDDRARTRSLPRTPASRRGSSPASSTRPSTGRSGRRPATTAGAASRSPGSWAAAAWRSCPAGMSRERFDWLERWVADPADIIRTPGTESNVKEIYDRCAELDREPDNVIFNQFSEFGNHLAHYAITGRALERVVRVDAGRGARPPPAGVRLGDRLGRHDRRRATTSRSATGRGSSPSRRSSARPCSRTASASTTSRASATSTSR